MLGVALLAFAGLSAFDQPAGTKLWDFYAGTPIQSSAAVAHNGIVYFGTDAGKLYSFYSNGEGKWEFPTQGPIVSSPAIGPDGIVYIGSSDSHIYAIEPSGVERWRFNADGAVLASPAVGAGGVLYFGTKNGRFFAVRPDGTKWWDVSLDDAVVGSPAVGRDGTIYVPERNGKLHAFAPDGNSRWTFKAPKMIISSPAIGHDGTIYFGCFDGHLYALTSGGQKRWTYATEAPVRGSPAIGSDGTIYFGSDDKMLYALASDGFKKWTFAAREKIRSTPAITVDGTIIFGSYDHSVYALNPSGNKRWEFVTDNLVTASPAIGVDGTIFFGSWNKRFYAVQGDSVLAPGVWAKFRGNLAQSAYLGTTAATTIQVASTTTVPEMTQPGNVTWIASSDSLDQPAATATAAIETPVVSAPGPVPAPTPRTIITEVPSTRELEYQQRIAGLESQIANLNAKVSQLESTRVATSTISAAQPVTTSVITESAGHSHVDFNSMPGSSEMRTITPGVTEITTNETVTTSNETQANEIIAQSQPRSEFASRIDDMEQRMKKMREELARTRAERDALKENVNKATTGDYEKVVTTSASPAETKETRSPPVVSSGASDAELERCLERLYGRKRSSLQSTLISLNEELASARVERARMQQTLADALESSPSAGTTIVPRAQRPTPRAAPPQSGNTGYWAEPDRKLAAQSGQPPGVPATGPTAVASQPEWLAEDLRELNSVNPDPNLNVPAPTPAVPQAASAPGIAAEEESAVRVVTRKKKPGFFARTFGRMFGRKSAEEEETTVVSSGNVTSVANAAQVAQARPRNLPTTVPSASVSAAGTVRPDGSVSTNFPRVAFTGGGSFFVPGGVPAVVPGVTPEAKLPGFPKSPVAVAPLPTRQMNPDRAAPEGLQRIEVKESVTVITPANALSVQIISPPDGSTLANPVLDLRGTASGNVSQVMVRVGNESFVAASGKTSWQHSALLKAGVNIVRAQALNATGKASAVVVHQYLYSEGGTILTLSTKGQGRITPDLNGRAVEPGSPVVLKAEPEPGYEFVGWRGINSTATEIRFIMNESKALVAVFQPKPGEIGIVAGRYAGLIHSEDVIAPQRSGYFELNVQQSGAFNGMLSIGAASAPLGGQIDAWGQGRQIFERPGETPLILNFQIDPTGNSDRIAGSLEADGNRIYLGGFRSELSGLSSGIRAGKYTMILPSPTNTWNSPLGDGFGEINIAPTGVLSFNGELPDGTIIKQKSYVSRSGIWPMHIPLYGGKGVLTGWVVITQDEQMDIHGDLRWITPPDPADTYYPNGFTSRRFAFGSYYDPNAQPNAGEVSVHLRGGGLNKPLKLQVPVKMDATTGIMSGTFLHPDTGKNVEFRGITVQKSGWRSGYFLGTDRSGVVHLSSLR